ncbi:DotU family type IV/VI secretion system protein [Desulfamplus magnetovallimortis]|uniref:DotU family type IV/VI secretion system protein n=1 Tax=Desulfamplus magnetovallimortis TaxID=1246637 RepID=UPI00164877FE|nr:DotU family type IV/VI secretion system protein [Desulfamplus magnetovallimortis]
MSTNVADQSTIDISKPDQPYGTALGFEEIKSTYSLLIDEAKAVAKSAGISRARMDRAFFAVFAWIDEVLLETNWQYREDWVKNPLQKIYFNTTNAGETFFKNLDKLGSEEAYVLEVYQYCLASGFKGALFQPFQQEELNIYKENTLKNIQTDQVPKLTDIIFPYAGAQEIVKLPGRKRWKGLAGFSYLFILLPILLFVSLFYFYNNKLLEMIKISVN